MIRGSSNLEHAVKRIEKSQSPIPVHVQEKINTQADFKTMKLGKEFKGKQ